MCSRTRPGRSIEQLSRRRLDIVMVALLAVSLLLGIAIMLLYFSGAFKSPYFGIPYILLFRLAFYLLLMLLMLMFWYGGKERSYNGHDPTVNAR